VYGLQFVEEALSTPRLVGLVVGEARALVDELGDPDSLAVVYTLIDVVTTCQ
jgi:hypothetical protein